METQSAFMGAAAATVLLSALVLAGRPRASLPLAGLLLAFAIWCLGRGVERLEIAWGTHASLVGLSLMPILGVWLAAGFAQRPEVVRRYGPWIAAGTLLALVGAWLPTADGSGIRASVYVWGALGGLAATALLMRGPREVESRPPEELSRLRYLAVAHALAVGGIALDGVAWGVGLPVILSPLVPLLYLYLAYLHLAGVRVADLRQLMAHTVALSLMALGLAALFAGVRIWVGERLDLFAFNAFVISFVLLLAFGGVRRMVDRVIDRWFVSNRLELEQSLRPLKDRLTPLLSLDEILRELLAALEGTSRLRTSSVFLRDDKNLGFQQAGSIGLPPRPRVSLLRDPIWVQALEQAEALVSEDLHQLRSDSELVEQAARADTLSRIMDELDAQVALPLRAGGELLGFWTLTDRRLDESLSSAELRLLCEVSDRLAASIQNSKTFERIRARDRMVALGEMATGLAHELRNPLAAIRGALELLADDDRDSEIFQEVLIEETRRLDRVVGSFLDYAGSSPQQETIADVAQLVGRAAASVARASGHADVKLDLEIEPRLPPVEADRAQLERVIVNLVDNAYAAVGPAGSVRLAVRSEPTPDAGDAWVEISVTDDGPGMDEATLDRALIPFFTTKQRGTGLGLAMCERLIEAQGGSLELRSRQGEGTRALIRLPCRPGQA